MRVCQVLSALALALPAWATKCATAQAEVSVLHTFSYPSWAENLAVRSNGQLLVSRLDAPAVYQVDPDTGDATLVYAWDADEYMGCLGIAETTTDVFYVITSAFVDDDFAKTSGVNAIQRIDMSTFALATDGSGSVATNATVSWLVDVPEAVFLNGMTTLDTTTILVSDVSQGRVYKVNTATAAYSVAVDDGLMKYTYVADPPTNLGCNGIKILDSYLYWTNTAAGFLARVPIDSGGGPIGSSAIVATNVPRADDFILRSDGVAFICSNQEDTLSVAYLNLDGSSVAVATPIAGSNISTTLAGVTAAKFGRRDSDSTRLYLSTSGALALAINGTVTVAGTVSYIDTSDY